MTLSASLLRKLMNPYLSVGDRAELCCELAKDFENKGEYEDAREVLKGAWRRIGERPKVESLEPGTAAEVLMRVGVLTGILGSQNQIANAQETAKNLISESLTIFETRSAQKKIAEARTELALCYWRTGEFNEARDLLKEALSRLTIDSELKALAILRLGIVERGAARHDKAVRVLTSHASLFDKIQSHTLKGCYHVNLGNALEDLSVSEERTDYVDRALVEYAAASYHFEQAQHRRYLANTEANLGMLYYRINRYEEAHKHLDRARRVLVTLKDTLTVAQVDETRASAFLKQGHISEAERTADSSVRRLEKSDRHTLLAEALITHGRALARLGNYGPALSAFRRAIALAERVGTDNWAAQAALAAFHEIGEHLVVSEGRKLTSGKAWREEIKSLERDLIKRALEDAQGSVTQAARNLGMSYQALAQMLNKRHRELVKLRTPVHHRSRKDQ